MLSRIFADAQTRRQRVTRVLLWLVIALACGYRVWLVFQYNPLSHLVSDPLRHWEQGTDTMRVDPISLMDPILYQVYVGVIARLTLQIPVLVAFYAALLSLLTPWLWYRFMREVLPSRTLALIGWAVLAWLPSWATIYSYFMQETLLLPLLGASLWATWRSRRMGTHGAFVLALMLWTLTGLTRAICIPLAGVAMGWIWCEQSNRALRATVSILILSAVLVPLSIRSLTHAHVIAPHGMGGLNILYARSGARQIKIKFQLHGEVGDYDFVSPSMNIQPFAPLSDWGTQREGAAQFFINLDEGSRDWDAAKASQPFELSRYLWLTSENLAFLFVGESWPDTDRAEGVGEASYQMRWLWAPLTVLTAVGTLVLWRRRRDALLPALMLTWFIVQGLTLVAINEGRYRKPFEGLLIVQTLAVAGMLRLRPTIAVPMEATGGRATGNEERRKGERRKMGRAQGGRRKLDVPQA